MDIAALKAELHRLIDRAENEELLMELYRKISAGQQGAYWWDALEPDARQAVPVEEKSAPAAGERPVDSLSAANWWDDLDTGLQPQPEAGPEVPVEERSSSAAHARPEPYEGFRYDFEEGEWKW